MANLLFRLVHLPIEVAHGVSYHRAWLKFLADQVALCVEHHKKADAGAYTADQLRQFKSNRANADLVRGSFDWLRRKFLLVVGGTFFFETEKAIVLDDIDVVALTRDSEGYLRLNIEVPSISAEPRALIKESDWFNIGSPSDLLISNQPQ